MIMTEDQQADTMEKPWRVVCSVDGMSDKFATLDEALINADEVLAIWREHAHDDGEWDAGVKDVEIHLVTHAARIVSRAGDNEDDGVEYGITEMLGNEIYNELRQLRFEVARHKNAMLWACDNFPVIRDADDCTFDGETFKQIAESV